MKKYLAITAVGLMSALVVAGCGRESSSTSTSPTVTYRSTTTTVKKPTMMDAYLETMRTKFPRHTDAQLIELGELSCDLIDAAGSIQAALISIAVDPSWSAKEAGDAAFTFGAAVPVFCPRYTAELKRIVS